MITSSAPATATEDTLYTYDAEVADPDGPSATWSLTAGDTCGGTIVPGTGVYTFTPAGPTPPASCVVAVQVCDGGTPDLCASQTTTVTIAPDNDPPVITSTAPTTATEDLLYTYNATSTDPDGPGATWSLLGSHTCTGSIVAGTGVFTFTPAGPVPPASCVVAVQVCDGAPGLCASQATTVAITAVNDPPIASNLSAAESYTEDTPLNLIDIVVSDGDSPTVTATLTLSNVAAGSLSTATSNAVTSTYVPGTVSGRPAAPSPTSISCSQASSSPPPRTSTPASASAPASPIAPPLRSPAPRP